MNWVVRGGLATPQSLMAGYKEHAAMPGLYGFSVQYAPGKSVVELAFAGQIRNGQISYASEDDLLASLQTLGYIMRLVRSPGHGFHHTFAVLYDNSGVMLTALPQTAADALSRVFRQQPNPYYNRP
jgi:hypothetical protein